MTALEFSVSVLDKAYNVRACVFMPYFVFGRVRYMAARAIERRGKLDPVISGGRKTVYLNSVIIVCSHHTHKHADIHTHSGLCAYVEEGEEVLK